MTTLARCRVPPFGHLGLNACVRLPRAFRSLPRPSSPSCAQASPIRLRSLDYNFPSSRARAIYSCRRSSNAARQRVNCFSRLPTPLGGGVDVRNCVTCVDSIATRTRCSSVRLTTTRAAPVRGLSHDHYFHPLSNSDYQRSRNHREACQHRRAPRRISRIEVEIGCGDERHESGFPRHEDVYSPAPLRR